MMKKLISIVLLLTAGVIAGVSIDHYLASSQDEDISVSESAIMHAKKHLDPDYVCPMHSQIVSGEKGTCPICGMDLVKIKTVESKVGDGDVSYPTVRVSSTMINNMGVRVAQVERKTLVRQIETPGFITKIQKLNFIRYKAPAKGRVVKLHFKQGQWLEPGDPLIDIELDDLVLVQEKHLELLAKETEQKKSKEDESDEGVSMAAPAASSGNDESPGEANAKAGEETLVESDEVVTEEQTVEPTLKKTRLLMRAAGMTDEQIATLEETKVTSPVITLYAKFAGEVEILKVDAGDEVNSNALLFTLGGLMRVTVLANAFQRDASWIKPGQEVDIILPHDSNKPWKGRVSSGAVSININSQNIGVELTFNAPHSVVKTGMYVVGNVYGQVQKDTLTLPREAIIYSRGEKRVIVALGEGRFKPVVVETGISNDNEVEILEGIEEGDTVVVSAQFLIDSESSLQASYRRMSAVEH
ncbi:MAG TPA: HlyD family efflux transporter periplasmic adaptor subunit [Gammaproteobacteria bacterium]|nr:HlyD family efflux transporter periplasmic adaptor subunit [Gammaproteobacteria bacterium]